MKIIPRYIFKELLAPFSLSLIAFTFVILMNKIIKLTELIVNKGVNLWTAVTLFSYIMPAFLVMVIPCTVLLASQIAFGRLSSDNETTALFSNGLSFYQFLPPVVVLSVFSFFITLFMMVFAAPHANRSFNSMLKQIGNQILESGSMIDLKERVFFDDFPDMVIYVNKIPPAGYPLYGVLISNYRQSKEPQVITARKGTLIHPPDSQKVIIRLEDGSIHNRIKEKSAYRKISFGVYELQLDMSKLLTKDEGDKREMEMTITELWQKIKFYKNERKTRAPFEVELYKKFTFPFACLLLGLIGAPLGMYSRGSSKSVSFMVSIGVIFFYYLFMRFAESLGSGGSVNPLLILCLPNVFLCVTAWYLVRKVANQSPIKLLECLSLGYELLQTKLKALAKLFG